jgi:hypothetical protein
MVITTTETGCRYKLITPKIANILSDGSKENISSIISSTNTTSNNTERPIINDDQLILPMKALEDTTETTEHRQSKIDHTVLMGQFNFASDVKDVVFWHNTWRTLFNRIVVRGPFSDDQITELRSDEYRIYAHIREVMMKVTSHQWKIL